MSQYIDVLLAVMIIASFLAAIALHECGHVLMALWLGDRTPYAEGRLTLRLRPQLDRMGVLMCFMTAFQLAAVLPVGLGWGQPVKPDPWKLRGGANTGVLLVACAGPLSSLLVGILTAMVVNFTNPFLVHNAITLRILQLLVVFAAVNIGLALFNLIPLYPLDGYQILYTILPSKQAVQFGKSAAYGPFIILFIFFVIPFLLQIVHIGIPIELLPHHVIGQFSLNLAGWISGQPLEIENWYLGRYLMG